MESRLLLRRRAGAVTLAAVSGVLLAIAAAAGPSAQAAPGARGPGPGNAGAEVGAGAGGGQPVSHFNVGATHSPELLRQLAHPASGGSRSSADGVIAGAVQGIDVASFQHPNGAAINWADVASSGIQFAAVKATEGTYYRNPHALSDLAAAKAAGLSVFAYSFAIPNGNGGSKSPVAQADYLTSYLGSADATVPVMLDIEYNPYGAECYGLSHAAMVAWIKAFDAEVQRKTGQLPVIYTPGPWWATCTGGSTAFGKTPLWVPDYSSDSSPALPAGWTTWAFWQYSSSGTVSGISDPGNVDLDQLAPGALPLLNPGSQASAAGGSADVQVRSADPGAGGAASFTAAGLPPGASISASGKITGVLSVTGSYQVTVSAMDGKGDAGSVSFGWAVGVAADKGPIGLVRLDLAGKCLNDIGNSAAVGTAADLYTCDGSSAERWTYAEDGSLRIHGECLQGTGSAGGRVRLESCSGSALQQWRLAYPRAVNRHAAGGAIALVNPGSGLCLADPGGIASNWVRVITLTCDGERAQAWTLPAGPVMSMIAGRCLDGTGNKAADGTKVEIRGCDGAGEQAWTVEPDGTLRALGRCLGVGHSGKSAGTHVDLQGCKGTGAQKWHVVLASGSDATLVNPVSGLCLADPSDSTAIGTWAVISTCMVAAGRQWLIQ
ncbi:MAG: GH25 family lysozyme [Streptosporangiaceae bacterium]|jgi:GH25 family lysozyme M1 (1,4-beta-N-acetylmuramidase)